MLLHFIGLSDNKMFVHLSVNTKWEDILEECLHFQFCQKHAPERIVLTLPSSFNDALITDPSEMYKKMVEEVDEIVLHFQDMFGKNDTRGGSFLDVEDEEKEEVEDFR
jgi:hypothetical protein